ncbi:MULTISPECIES: catalase/peroxidase HPI [Glutamicibacter]|jgi:catalase-peroxidase|uniref:Catalase-peroxidase n=2 Tax=Glutamicibacter arilaitensis TaxID=256701 RepID=A0A2N7S095_9MICC|nr:MULTISPECIES: catalase/peroxidase HPI [Glutamicibacter]PMQ19558.1 catalase/peroxidase HPI [Glutamicibacter arilaitensis]CBT74486.1 peroxidase/catalase [Glutamicibacter arilaitensis Re117]HCH47191.1 catalase/peroxidase HPI [Glutamicibacter sp.]HCJ53866.1 catalase/peroxidase HPI [Glutamicibacter sp.]HCM94062.1 catalase/peroxidase HPI [Glutamicibacter sp.]
MSETTAGQCPVVGQGRIHPTQGNANTEWWPNKLNLKILAKNQQVSNPLDEDFDYIEAFNALDMEALKADLIENMTTRQDWWPADFNHYGPLYIRMAWHSAGTYRSHDGRGGGGAGQQRFAPLNAWPDNVGLDKARRLLWPVKKKYGQSISWADLMILAGNVAMEHMGLKTFGFAGGRKDVWEADDDVYWGPEKVWLDNERYSGERDLEAPLAAVQMGLIYVNPEGPDGNPDPLASAIDVRETFRRMGMDDYETVALIAGGHTFGKTHGANNVDRIGADPEAAPLEEQGLGWKNGYGEGNAENNTASGLEVTWTYHPTRWDNEFFHILFAYEWELFESAAGAKQWRPVNGGGAGLVQPAHDTLEHREPRMLTSDLALRFDPIYGPISKNFKENPDEFAEAYARAWFKLTHRDMGPKSRYFGPEVPAEDLAWQDPLPAAPQVTLGVQEIAALKALINDSGLTVQQLVSTAWKAASSFRSSDKRGGANGGRIRLEPQVSWTVNQPEQLKPVIAKLEEIVDTFNATSEIKASFADVVVLAGNVGVEQAAAAAGQPIEVPFTPGRVDATQEQTDVEQFAWLEPVSDGLRNYDSGFIKMPSEYLLIDKANLLGLSAPELTVLVGGLRVLGNNWDGSNLGVFTENPGALTNDFFANLLEPGIGWTASEDEQTYHSKDGRWVGSRVDLVFGANSELRAVAEVYASDDAKTKFVKDFAQAWAKVMDSDRFELRRK